MPFGPVTNFLLAQKKISGQPKAGSHFRHCYWPRAPDHCLISKTVQKKSNMVATAGLDIYLRALWKKESYIFLRNCKYYWTQNVHKGRPLQICFLCEEEAP